MRLLIGFLALASVGFAQSSFFEKTRAPVLAIKVAMSYCDETYSVDCVKGGLVYAVVAQSIAQYRNACPKQEDVDKMQGIFGTQGQPVYSYSCNLMIGSGAGFDFRRGGLNACIGHGTCADLTDQSNVTEIRLLAPALPMVLVRRLGSYEKWMAVPVPLSHTHIEPGPKPQPRITRRNQ